MVVIDICPVAITHCDVYEETNATPPCGTANTIVHEILHGLGADECATNEVMREYFDCSQCKDYGI